jgi:hypothetical protein
LATVVWLFATLLPVFEASGQGTVYFSNLIPGDPGVGTTLHIWGPSSNNSPLALVGLGSNDSPSGTVPFAESGMTLIGANGSGGHFGSATTFAQLIGSVGADQPPYTLAPVGQTTTFRSGSAAGTLVSVTDTLVGIPKDAPAATFTIVAWDNSSGLYPTWTQASVAWTVGSIGAGYSAPFTVTNIGGDLNVTPYLNNSRGTINGMTSFNLYYSLSLWSPLVNTLPATEVTAHSATLNGTVQCFVHPTAGFQWGATPIYGNATPPTEVSTSPTNAVHFSAYLTGLNPGTPYYFRAGANTRAGSAQGSGAAFTTLTSPLSLIISAGKGYWDAASSALSYEGDVGGSQSLILLQSTNLSAPLSAWTRVATNHSIPGSFPIPPVDLGGPGYYRIKSE